MVEPLQLIPVILCALCGSFLLSPQRAEAVLLSGLQAAKASCGTTLAGVENAGIGTVVEGHDFAGLRKKLRFGVAQRFQRCDGALI